MVSGIVQINPFADPVSFIIYFYIFSVSAEGFPALLKLALVSSVLAFPFALLADRIYSRLSENPAAKPLVLMFASALLTTIAFWLVMLLWQLASGRAISGDIVLPLLGSSVVAFAFGLLGHYILSKIKSLWKMPKLLAIYVSSLATCIIFWAIVWLYSMLAPLMYQGF
jgi:hypothetical protein